MQIALIGHGKMGSAMLEQWRKAADGSDRFTVIDPSVAQVQADGATVSYRTAPPSRDEVAFDLVIMAVKPQMIDQVLPDYADRLAGGGFVASVAAGVSLDRLRALAGNAPVVRIMPNLPAAIGRGVSGLCAHSSVSAAQRDAIERLMTATGTTQWVDSEDALDRFTALAGSGPGYVFEIAARYVDAAVSLGFEPDVARRLVLDTMAGTIAMAQTSPLGLDALRDSVTSKGGTTAAGLAALGGTGTLDALLRDTLDAAYARAVELR